MEKKEIRTVTTKVTFTESVEEVDPPHHELTTDFKNLEDWLLNLCEGETQKTSISNYRFGVFESKDGYVVFCVGLNTYGDANHSDIKIDFEPVHKYYQLQGIEFKNLNRSQVFNKLTDDLKSFTNTQKFKNSFFARAKFIKTDFSGIIWTNEESM